MPASTALYVDEALTFGVHFEDIELPVPDDGEILVEPEYSGANPADAKHATLLGIYPTRLGYDFCGKVLKASPGSKFHVGETVAGYTPTGLGRPAKYGAHQTYTICPEDMAFAVPDNLPRDHAACLPVVTMTAADALYNHFKFPLPQHQSHSPIPNAEPGPLLIWGASSSVGICAVQLARASGVSPILVTASPNKHTLLSELGATHCFDYKSPTVLVDIKKTLTELGYDHLPYGLDAVGAPECAQSTASCVSEDGSLVSVEFQKDERFLMATGITNADVTMKPVHFPRPVTVPARPDDHWRAWSVLNWVAANYGTGFRFPSVHVFNGMAGDALEELKKLAGLGRGFGKLVLKHPLM